MYEIRTDIPLPVPKRGRKSIKISETQFPEVEILQVNECFIIDQPYSTALANRIRSCVNIINKKVNAEKKEDRKISVREYEGKIGVWRIS